MVTDTTKNVVIRQRVLRSTVANYAGRFVMLGIGFLLTPFILGQLGGTAYGLWTLVGSVVGYGALLDLGISGAVVKYVAEYRVRNETEQARGLIATALCLYSVLGLIIVGISIVIAPIFPSLFPVPAADHALASWLVLVSGVGVGVSIPCTTSMAVLRGLQRYDIVNLVSATGTLLSAAATVVVLLLGGGLLGMVAVNLPVMLLMQALSIWLIKRVAPELRFGWRGAKRSLVRTVFSFSSWVFIGQMSGRLKTQTDEIVIGAFLLLSAVTPYSIARRLAEAAQLLTDQFVKVLVPLASELHAENDWTRLRMLYITSTRLTLAIFLPIGCSVVVLAKPILTLWVGEEYAQYAYLVVILTVASFVDTSLWPAASVLQGIARHRTLAIMSVGTAVANLGLSILLVRGYNLAGVAWGTLIPIVIECTVLVLPYVKRVVGLSAAEMLTQIFLPTLLPAIPATATLYLLQYVVAPSSWLSVLMIVGVGTLVYLIGYVGVGASAAEREAYRDVARSTMHIASTHLRRS